MTDAIKYLVSIHILFSFLFVGCGNQSSGGNLKNADTNKIEDHDDTLKSRDSLSGALYLQDTFSHDDEFVSGIYKVVITTTYINDTLSEEEAWEAIQWPIVKSQKVTFKCKDSVCTVFEFPTRKISRQTKKGGSVKAAEVIIWNAGLIQGKNTTLFGIPEATGLCTGSYCPTYNGVFNLTGVPVYQLFKNEAKELSLLVGKEARKITDDKSISHKIDSINRAAGITREIETASWNSRRKIGIN